MSLAERISWFVPIVDTRSLKEVMKRGICEPLSAVLEGGEEEEEEEDEEEDEVVVGVGLTSSFSANFFSARP